MFRKGDIVRFEGGDSYAAKFGALAIVSQQPNEGGGVTMVMVEWLEVTSHLSNKQTNGGYSSDNFKLIAKGKFDKESILVEIENELDWLDGDTIKERFMNILGEMEIYRLENILEDIEKDVDKTVIRDKSY